MQYTASNDNISTKQLMDLVFIEKLKEIKTRSEALYKTIHKK